MARIRVGMIAPPWFSVPPAGYGGIERVVSYLADGLDPERFDVTLFASGGSETRAHLHTTFAEPPSAELGDPMVESRHLLEAYCRARDFDLLHDHSALGLPAAAAIDVPVVHTIHNKLTSATGPLYAEASERGVHLVTISRHQRTTLPTGTAATVVYNGVDLERFPYGDSPGDYLLFVGRMNADKGVLDAVEIARRAGKRLVLVTKVIEESEKEYFATAFRPVLDERFIDLRFETPPEELAALYRGALATLFPIHWPEPFGLVMIESMASGTPVIAFRAGSVPEVVEDGVTGFICAGVDEAVGALGRVHELGRAACRARVERLFSAATSTAHYAEVYTAILEGRSPAAAAGLAAPSRSRVRL